ncbi:2-keto-4-pentenoate hydratase [Undibacterium sp.]|uniref:2-keto-4-pentenoate hydratase n=1 Tax=Undibacterium sp. TaxID=1914977 RepID=UPI00374CA17F
MSAPDMLSTRPQAETGLAELLSGAYQTQSSVAVPATQAIADADQAYAVQRDFLSRVSIHTGGWKIGAKSSDGPIQGSPLPLDGIYQNNAVLNKKHFPILGLELEIAFSFDRDFTAADAALSDVDIMQHLHTMQASVELVSSRLAGWPEVGKLLQLADLQNHGALVTGDPVVYDADFPFLNPRVSFRIADNEIFNGKGSNPAGDPRRLLPWLVRHCAAQGLTLASGTTITTGSYTGVHFPLEAGAVRGKVQGLPPIQFQLA